jgi:hypothetical protein
VFCAPESRPQTKRAKAFRLKGEGFRPGEWKNKIIAQRSSFNGLLGSFWENGLSGISFVEQICNLLMRNSSNCATFHSSGFM